MQRSDGNSWGLHMITKCGVLGDLRSLGINRDQYGCIYSYLFSAKPARPNLSKSPFGHISDIWIPDSGVTRSH